MRNTLGDLNLHLFAELERLGDEELKDEKLQEEITRAKAVNEVATQIISNGSLVLAAKKFMDNRLDTSIKLPPMLEGEKHEHTSENQK